MADLVVSDLTGLAEDLRVLIDEFKGALDLEGETGYVWGQENANLSMNDFANNWTPSRDDMVATMESLLQKVVKVNEGWEKGDQELSKSLEKKEEK